jgi:ribosomal protein S18 acetylase RimI-like enzyme
VPGPRQAAYELVELDGEQALVRREGLTGCYRSVFTGAGFAETEQDVERFADEQLPGHAVRDGFRMMAALADDSVLGFGYGYTGRRGQWWSDRVVEAVPAALSDTWVGGHFELVELTVHPDHQGLGIGGRLHDTLLAGLPHARALLGTSPDDARAAVALYRSRGWQRLARLSDTSDLWGRRLP